jgi:hypothetical protein
MWRGSERADGPASRRLLLTDVSGFISARLGARASELRAVVHTLAV